MRVIEHARLRKIQNFNRKKLMSVRWFSWEFSEHKENTCFEHPRVDCFLI